MSPTETQKAWIADAISASTQEVFATMLSLEIAPEGAAETERTPQPGLVALIGLAGIWSGAGSLTCSGAFACSMASSFLANPCETVNEEVLDAVGEIANMIIGNVKTALEERFGTMGLSTPTIIYGGNFQTRSARIHEWIVVPFVCGSERMTVQVCVAPNQASARPNMAAGLHLAPALPVGDF